MIVVKPIDKRIDEVTKKIKFMNLRARFVYPEKKNKIKVVHLLKMNLLVQNC